jgi:hypothetical protein
VALRDAIPQPDQENVGRLDTDELHGIMLEGATVAVERAFRSADASARLARTALKL